MTEYSKGPDRQTRFGPLGEQELADRINVPLEWLRALLRLATKRYLTERELANRLAVSVKTVQTWRQKGGGPEYKKMGGSIRYPIDAIELWEASIPLIGSTSEG